MLDLKNSRMCVDYRGANKKTQFVSSNIGDVEAAINKVGRHKYAVTLDISSAFKCVSLAKRCGKYLAFSLPNDPTQWQPTTLPFGHSLSPVLFGKALMKILGPDLVHSEHVSIFVDDMMVTGDTFSEVLLYLDLVLDRLEKGGLCIRPTK